MHYSQLHNTNENAETKAIHWLKRPIAHRGLHNAKSGIIENTVAALEAAIQGGFGVEVDLQPANDFTPFIFHDATLDRLTLQNGRLRVRTPEELKKVKYKECDECLTPLSEFLKINNGRAPLLLEVKSENTNRRAIAEGIVAELDGYDGDIAVASFDPHLLAEFRTLNPSVMRGQVASGFPKSHAKEFSFFERFMRRHLLSSIYSRPAFIAFDCRYLPAIAPFLARRLFRLPILTWTVRNVDEQHRVKHYADAIIFEEFYPQDLK